MMAPTKDGDKPVKEDENNQDATTSQHEESASSSSKKTAALKRKLPIPYLPDTDSSSSTDDSDSSSEHEYQKIKFVKQRKLPTVAGPVYKRLFPCAWGSLERSSEGTPPAPQITVPELDPIPQIAMPELEPTPQITTPESELTLQIAMPELEPTPQITTLESELTLQIAMPESEPALQITMPVSEPTAQIATPDPEPTSQIATSEPEPTPLITTPEPELTLVSGFAAENIDTSKEQPSSARRYRRTLGSGAREILLKALRYTKHLIIPKPYTPRLPKRAYHVSKRKSIKIAKYISVRRRLLAISWRKYVIAVSLYPFSIKSINVGSSINAISLSDEEYQNSLLEH